MEGKFPATGPPVVAARFISKARKDLNMKLSDIVVGGRYRAKVSGTVCTVRVVELKEVPPASWSATGRWRTLIYAVNEATGRKITIRSPQRLRSKVEGVTHE